MLQRSEIPSLAVIASILLSLLCALGGCSESSAPDYELGQVRGKVTLDGAPVEGAEVVFEPQQAGAMSFGTTDSDGIYELIFNADTKGAALGLHVVRIRKIGGPETAYDTQNMLPPQYDEQSQLTATVESGENEFNFDLASSKK